MTEWLGDNKALLWWTTGASVLLLAVTMVAAPIVLVRLPADYFSNPERRKQRARGRGMAVKVIKNVAGAVVLLAGLAMLVLPGQGLVCVLLGVMLLDFPGRDRVERWILSRKRVLSAINWLRRKFRKPPMQAAVSA